LDLYREIRLEHADCPYRKLTEGDFMIRISSSLACFALAVCAFAQSRPPAAAHWEGVIHVPNRDMKIAIDLDQNEKGEWIGDLDFPQEGMTDFPLSHIAVEGNTVKFEMAGIPGDPSFDGEISPDGKILAGDFGQGGGSVPGELKWVSEPKVVLPARNTAIAKEFEGSWEGSIPGPDGQAHAAVLKLANGADGRATGLIVGREGMEFGVSSIAQTGSRLQFEVKAIGGMFSGELKGDELTGTWKAGGSREFPLAFRRASK
jgi:hypothetical protein